MTEDQNGQPNIPTSPPPQSAGFLMTSCAVTAMLTMLISVAAVIWFARSFHPQWRKLTGIKCLTEDEYEKVVEVRVIPEERPALSNQNKVLVVNIKERSENKDDPLYVVESKRVNLFELQKMVRDGVQQDENMSVLIRGDKLAVHGDVAKAIAACHAGGASDANIAYIDQPDE